MSDVFISYAREDREQAGVLARALEELGWSVWWDRIIPTGRSFDTVIEDELDAAKCVIVLWSSSSISSNWVKAEASRAVEQKKLFPALSERVVLPLAFSRFQTADLVDWDGERTTGGFLQLVTDMGRILGVAPKEAEKQRRAEEARTTKEEELESAPGTTAKVDKPPTVASEATESAQEQARPRRVPLPGKLIYWAGAGAVIVALVLFLVFGLSWNALEPWAFLGADTISVADKPVSPPTPTASLPAEERDGKTLFVEVYSCNLCHPVGAEAIQATTRFDTMKASDLSGFNTKTGLYEIAAYRENHRKSFNGTDEQLQVMIDWLGSTLE